MDRKVWMVTRAKFPKRAGRDHPHYQRRPSLEKRHYFYYKRMNVLVTGKKFAIMRRFDISRHIGKVVKGSTLKHGLL